ncbi:hypothetical protein N7530_000791 [Penicillium desertorum]|uniref:Uncharacterized protein n=1 Tax=Penicillium desertorum TaxID=1303715 RepID=A0A9W9X9G5_9EURO|nr:hypothetical protein N7530_000791 [Penicillium desertorum]
MWPVPPPLDVRLSDPPVFLIIATNNPPIRQRNTRWPSDFNSWRDLSKPLADGTRTTGRMGLAQPVPGRNPKWPTVVVEVGVSESYRELRADAQWWLTNSRSDVKLVIIVSVSRKTPNIKFETVALDPTRYVPKIRQTITASRDANNPNSQITIRPAVALAIGFEELFCRQPVPPEHNIDLSPYELGEISTDVWGGARILAYYYLCTSVSSLG